MSKKISLKQALKRGVYEEARGNQDARLKELQLQILRIQQGIFHSKKRAIIAVEGFDAAGKGGAIRRLTERLDPRGAQVHPIGPPSPTEQGRHWLYRFWTALPAPGTIAIFDRTWYGRVLVERVDQLTPSKDWKRGYREIREFEKMLIDDGVDLVKIFLAISKEEQRERFIERLKNPYKQWKLTPSDLEARSKWNDYVVAVDDAFAETQTRQSPWHLIPADNKEFARLEFLKTIAEKLGHHRKWMEAQQTDRKAIRKALKQLEKSDR